MPKTPSSPPASPRSCSTSRRSPRSTCAAARPARARPTCSQPAQTVERVDAIVLSGGSAFGLDAPCGVQAWLREQGRGFAVREARVPIVPGAILFDLLKGGDKDWGRYPPYRELGFAAAANAGSQISRSATRRRRTRRDHRQSERRPRLGLGDDARRRDRRRDRRRQRGRQRHGRRRAAFLGRAVRAEPRVRRARPALAPARRRAVDPPQGRSAREHHHRAGRDRRDAHQGAGEAPRDRRA